MKQIISNQGIVLKITDYKEQAVIAKLLTQTGIKDYIIRGAKKMNGGTRLLASPLTKLSFNATESNGLDTLTEGVILNNYLPIKQDIKKMAVAYPILEKILVFSPQVTDNKVFYQFVNEILELLLSDLNELVVLAIFEIKLTYLIGIAPELNICIKCHKKIDSGYFSINEGGVYCHSCLGAHPYELNPTLTNELKLLYLIKPSKADKKLVELLNDDINRLLEIIDLYYINHLDFSSKAKNVTKTLLK